MCLKRKSKEKIFSSLVTSGTAPDRQTPTSTTSGPVSQRQDEKRSGSDSTFPTATTCHTSTLPLTHSRVPTESSRAQEERTPTGTDGRLGQGPYTAAGTREPPSAPSRVYLRLGRPTSGVGTSPDGTRGSEESAASFRQSVRPEPNTVDPSSDW